MLGTEETIGPLTREQMQAYFKARYVPGNMVLYACGNLDEDALLKETEKLWGGRSGPRAERASPPPIFHPGKNGPRKKGPGARASGADVARGAL